MNPHPPQDLLSLAQEAWERAYAPYSGFRVGAALRTATGRTFQGANVENASYGLSRCAEQSAVQAMASAGERNIREVVVYTHGDTPATPCGACRQVLAEFGPDARVYLVNQRGDVRRFSVDELLPAAFRLDP